jgi:hypothetical protein
MDVHGSFRGGDELFAKLDEKLRMPEVKLAYKVYYLRHLMPVDLEIRLSEGNFIEFTELSLGCISRKHLSYRAKGAEAMGAMSLTT